MLPLIAYETELEQVRGRVEQAAAEAQEKAGEVPYSIGTMLELPRACLVADRIAKHADFFSFGTNDLTQTAIGLSRDDVEAKFLGRYVEEGIIDRSPFETIDEPGVGELVAVGTERGREAKPDLKVGVCGEHGGDPDSVAFFDRVGLDYVSCSPYRVPIARVAAAQAAARLIPTARFGGMATPATETFEDRVRSWEAEYLWEPATRSYPALRAVPEPDSPVRTPFQRDRDRIVHSKAFRRLKHKTQVFVAPEGDHYRTRLTHTLEACIISRTVARALGLNEDLTEAVGLGHDLGHPPFGHIGEEVLDEALREHGGGFRHNEHSLRVVEVLEEGRDGPGLNLTEQVRDGILRHTGPEKPGTLEGRLVRIVDRVAYINHDIDDAVRAGIISESDLPAARDRAAGGDRGGAGRHAGAGHGRALARGGRHRPERGGGRRDAAAAQVHVRPRVPGGRGAGRAGAGAGGAERALRPLRGPPRGAAGAGPRRRRTAAGDRLSRRNDRPFLPHDL